VKTRLLLTGAGSAATSNLIRSLRAGYRSLTIVGCHSDRFLLKKSSADRNYLVPALAHPGYFRALRRVMARERIDLLIPTTDAEVRAFTRPRTRLPGRLFLPRQAVVDLCQDKYRLNVALRARGVPVPLTYPVSSLRALERIFARLPAHSPVWCRVRRGSGSTGAIPVKNPAQARSWIAYWTEMRGVPATSFILSEYLPGRDFSCQAIWKSGALVLVKTCERLSYFGGGSNPSGTSSISQLAKTVFAPDVVAVCTAAIRAIDPRASGTFNFDLRESSRGEPCITEINAGRFPSGTNIFDLTGRVNLAATFVRVALDVPVAFREPYDPAEGYYSVRDLDTLTGVFHADELFDKIVDARQ
jgi:carbamoylphosphate synthase large subunit